MYWFLGSLLTALLLVPADQPPEVEWLDYKPKRQAEAGLLPFLTDVESHLDPKHGRKYRFDEVMTWCHETTHGVNQDIGNAEYDGFYVGGNKAAKIKRPRIKMTDAARFVPSEFRTHRYKEYMVNQPKTQPILNELPLYVFDEWVAYNNGLECGLEYAAKGRLKEKSDYAYSVLEFSVYATAIAAEVWEIQPDYWKKETQFKAFLVHEIKRSLRLHKEAMKYECFKWDSKLYDELKTSKNCKWIRDAWKEWGIDLD